MFSKRGTEATAPNGREEESREPTFTAVKNNMTETDSDMPMGVDNQTEEEPDRLTVGTDFGTTFSCVAFAINRDDIQAVKGYPADPMTLQYYPRSDVPTESWYPNKVKLEELAKESLRNANEPVLKLFDSDDDSEDSYSDPLGIDSRETTPKMMYWGYEVQDKLSEPDLDKSQYNCIERSKLMLDTSEETIKVRKDLNPILKKLKARKCIKSDEDVIAQYLEQLFLHAKQYLKGIRRLKDTTIVEHVLCVPVIWSASACRKMQSAMEVAIQRSDFGTVKNLFLVSEPEAAAAYVLANSGNLNPDETFIILDAGGGTVDATTYTVGNTHPLKLKREEVAARGGLFGSSYLNEEFRKYLFGRLESEKSDIETNGRTIEGIVDQQTMLFENKLKRTMDVTNKQMKSLQLHIDGIRENPEKGFETNRVTIHRNDFWEIFERCLRGNIELMSDQVRLSREAKLAVKKIVLIGGFSNNPSLRKALEKRLRTLNKNERLPIELVTLANPNLLEAAMASGAILRVFDKEDDELERRSLCSYGLWLQEEYNPEEFPEHDLAEPRVDSINGVKFVEVLDWIVKKGEIIPAAKEYRIQAHCLFAETRKRYIYQQELYISDTSTESHYTLEHPKNEGAEIAGMIQIDMGELIRSGNIPLLEMDHNVKGKRHYHVEFELVMKVRGRNLEVEGIVAGTSLGSKEISIAASFVPGTK